MVAVPWIEHNHLYIEYYYNTIMRSCTSINEYVASEVKSSVGMYCVLR